MLQTLLSDKVSTTSLLRSTQKTKVKIDTKTTKMDFYVKVPFIRNYSHVICYPSPHDAKHEKLLLFSKELKEINCSGDYLLFPYMLGCDYALLPASDVGKISFEYSQSEPSALKYFPYSTELERLQVLKTIFFHD